MSSEFGGIKKFVKSYIKKGEEISSKRTSRLYCALFKISAARRKMGTGGKEWLV